MKRKILFHKGGTGAVSARVTIPPEFLELMKITEDDRDVEITFQDGKLIIEKAGE